MSNVLSLIDALVHEAETNNEMDNRSRLASAKKALLDALDTACAPCANKDALIRDLAKQLDGVVPRAPGCKCHLEIGDSPCPVHGECEESLDVREVSECVDCPCSQMHEEASEWCCALSPEGYEHTDIPTVAPDWCPLRTGPVMLQLKEGV